MQTANLSRETFVERLVGDLTESALETISPRVPERGSVAVELELWRTLEDAFRSEDRGHQAGDPDHPNRAQAMLMALVQAAFQVALAHGATGHLLELVGELRSRFEAVTRQLRYRGLVRGPKSPWAHLSRAIAFVPSN